MTGSLRRAVWEFRMRVLQPVRGTQDLLPAVARRHRRVVETVRAAAELYGFAEMATPIFEFTEVFARPIGEHTDIVSKEMYTFNDRGGEEVTLRPENTASVVRSVISNGLTQSVPLKFFYSGPMFRYERPQKGRFRQFHQIGVELIGVAQPQADIEVIALGSRILVALGVGDRVELQLNTLGNSASRSAYREALIAYFSARVTELSEDSRRRLERNPLRIFDSKEETDRPVVRDAPAFADYLDAASCQFFDQVRAGIERLAMPIAAPPLPRPVALVPIGEAGEIAAVKLAEDLRDGGFLIDLGYSGNLARRLRRADKMGAIAAILLGDDELARGVATVRDLINGTQSTTPLAELRTRLRVLTAERANT